MSVIDGYGCDSLKIVFLHHKTGYQSPILNCRRYSGSTTRCRHYFIHHVKILNFNFNRFVDMLGGKMKLVLLALTFCGISSLIWIILLCLEVISFNLGKFHLFAGWYWLWREPNDGRLPIPSQQLARMISACWQEIELETLPWTAQVLTAQSDGKW